MWNSENARKKKISVDFMKNRVHIAQKNENRNCENVENDEKKYWMISLTLEELRTMIQIWNRFHKTKCRNGNDANVERKAVGKAFREIRREL